MSVYDSEEFSKIFSRRTKDNYKFIKSLLDSGDYVISKGAAEEFTEKLKNDIKCIRENLFKEARKLQTAREKNKKELSHKALDSASSKLKDIEDDIESERKKLFLTDSKEKNKYELYEVTQLLNSLMGISVLPYEMHRGVFFDKSQTQRDRRNKIRKSSPYNKLKEHIIALYDSGKWNSTYHREIINGKINDDDIVFNFLKHIRNAVCHSGNNALSIFPLLEGSVISHIMFYDTPGSNNQITNNREEFAMCISVSKLEELIFAIANFYENSLLGEINKTKEIEEAEEHIQKLLSMRLYDDKKRPLKISED